MSAAITQDVALCVGCGETLHGDEEDGLCVDCRVELEAAMERHETRVDHYGDERTTWAPVPLDEILSGDYTPPVPAMLARIDGRCLLYPGRSHAVSAEPEALKTWFALGASAEQLNVGASVLYIDMETGAAEIVGRLRALGVDPKVISEGFIYLRPDEPLTDASLTDLDAVLEHKPALTIIDGVTEAFNIQGLSPLDNTDVATWLELLPRRIIRAASTSLILDHVVKDKEARGRYAIGAQHKLAGVDVHYSLEVVEPFGRGHDGVVTVKVQKDRPGGIREFAQDNIVATLRATSHEGGRVSISLEPPELDGPSVAFRPTILMERISNALEGTPGLSKRGVRTAVGGKREYVDLALELLIAEGHVRIEHEGSAHKHVLTTPYLADRGPVAQPCPDRGPSDGGTVGDRGPVPKAPLGARERATKPDAGSRDLETWPRREL